MLTSALLVSTALTANASYTAIYGEKQINGDNIVFVKKGKWIKTAPSVSEWANDGSVYGCTNWAPAPNTVAVGTTFPQTANDCTVKQKRTIQNREQNDYTLVYRNIGDVVNESQTLTNQSNTRTANGTKIVNECGTGDINQYRWVNGTPSFSLMYIIWDGVKVFPDIGNINLAQYDYNGYRYTKGAQTANYGYYTFNTVCRVKL